MSRAIASLARVLALGATLIVCLAADSTQPAALQWTSRDLQGREVRIPTENHVTVIALLRAGQSLSVDAIAEIRASLSRDPEAKCVAVFSGNGPADAITQFAQQQKIDWPIVVDPDYALSGKLAVSAWPTTVVVAADGAQIAHLAGLPASFGADLAAYLDFAFHKIDQTTLQQRIGSVQVVQQTAKQRVTYCVTRAMAALDEGDVASARQNIEAGLKIDAADVELNLALARVQLKSQQAEQSLQTLAPLEGKVPQWQLNVLRGEAMIALNRWADAKALLPDAVKLNPHPGRAYYLLGLVYRHDGDTAQAADAFQHAYEAATKPSR